MCSFMCECENTLSQLALHAASCFGDPAAPYSQSLAPRIVTMPSGKPYKSVLVIRVGKTIHKRQLAYTYAVGADSDVIRRFPQPGIIVAQLISVCKVRLQSVIEVH